MMRTTTATIWREFSANLDRFIRSRVAEPAVAEDILQDVFLKLQSRLDELRDPTKLKGWLFLVARNAIIDHYRTQKKTTELTDALPAEWSEYETEEQELAAVLHRLLNRVPEPYREALVLTEFEGLAQTELAKRLNISVSGAKSRVQRGRERLKELLLEFCHREFGRLPGALPCPKGLIPPVQPSASQGKSHRRRATAKNKKEGP